MSHHAPNRTVRGAARAALLGAATLAVGCATPAPETPRDLLEAAIVARYGDRADSPPAGAVLESRGTFYGLDCHQVTTFLHPNLLRVEFGLAAMDEGASDRLFDGRSFHERTPAGLRKMTPDEARILLGEAFDATAFWLLGLRDANMTMELLDPLPFDGQDVVTLQVAHRLGYLRLLHFDAGTLDLVGMEGNATTEFGRQYVVTAFSDFETFDGVRLPTRTEARVEDQVTRTFVLERVSFDDLPDLAELLQGPSATP